MRQLNSLLVILAIALRALVPAGFMIAPSVTDAASVIVICTGHGPQTLALDENGNPVAPKPRSEAAICPFAAALAVASALSLPELPAPQAEFAAAPALAPDAPATWASRILRPPPRAPPVVS